MATTQENCVARGQVGARVLAALCLIACAGALAAPARAGVTKIEVLKMDSARFPAETLYLQVPEGAWIDGSADVEFKDKPAQSTLEAYDLAATEIDSIAANNKPDAGPEGIAEGMKEAGLVNLPVRPVSNATASLLGFEQQDDAAESTLVVLLIDVSRSMRTGAQDDVSALDEVKALGKAVIARLRDGHDRVAIATFANHPKVVLPPTDDLGRATRRLERVAIDGDSTFVFDAVANVLQNLMRNEASPSLPGRRYLFVFSDGRDEGSDIQPQDLGQVLAGDAKKPEVFTVGVGRKLRHDQYADLRRIALFSGNEQRFHEIPRASSLAEAFVRERALLLQGQLMLHFDVPTFAWKKEEIEATLRITPQGGKVEVVDVKLPVTLSTSQVEESQAYQAALHAAVLWKANKERKRQYIIYGTSGGVALLLLIIVLVILSKRSRKRRQQQQERLEEMEQNMQGQLHEQLAQQEQRLEQKAEQEARVRADEARVVLAILLGMEGPFSGKRFAVLKTKCIAGRDAERCDLVFPTENGDAAMSRTHAQFELSSGEWSATCLSNGGMYVNRTQIRKGERYAVKYGDQVKIGKSIFQFSSP